MTTYKLAVCDDNFTDAEYVTDLVQHWAREAKQTVHIDTFPSAEAFLFQYAENKEYDILRRDLSRGISA